VFEYLQAVFPEYIVSKILLYLTHPCCDLIKRDLSSEFGYNEEDKTFKLGVYSKIFTRIRIIQKYRIIDEKLSDNIKNEWKKLISVMHSRHDENSYICNTVCMMDEHQFNLDKFCKERKMIQNKLRM
jgi:stress-induced morphogen